MTAVRAEQPEKAEMPISVTPSGILMFESDVQPTNASLLMLVTDLPRYTLVRFVQP